MMLLSFKGVAFETTPPSSLFDASGPGEPEDWIANGDERDHDQEQGGQACAEARPVPSQSRNSKERRR
jgi:hypothetical protein